MDNQTNQNKQYGSISEGLFFRLHVGDVTATDGKKFEIATAMNMSPMVLYKNRVFELSWNEICNMASDMGLLDDNEEQ
ncbi:MAG: hypothetical protein RR348_04930, partial [Clostridia bacterium]